MRNKQSQLATQHDCATLHESVARITLSNCLQGCCVKERRRIERGLEMIMNETAPSTTAQFEFEVIIYVNCGSNI